MRRQRLYPLLTLLTALLFSAGAPALAGVSISVGEPGFYGRIEIGNSPPPRLIYREPIIVRQVSTWSPPIYLRVPPGHAKQWYRYCDRYDACGRPVYFVEDSWYQEIYVPQYRSRSPRVYHYTPPVIIRQPDYYEYRKHDHRPPKKIYPHRDRDYRDYHDRGWDNDHRGRGRDHR